MSVSIKPDTIYYSSNTLVSTESRHLSVITCSSSGAIYCAHMFWILRHNRPVITHSVKWSIVGGTKALNILECLHALVLLFIMLLTHPAADSLFFSHKNTNAFLEAKPMMSRVITLLLVGHCCWHVTRLATGLMKSSLSRSAQINWNKKVLKRVKQVFFYQLNKVF